MTWRSRTRGARSRAVAKVLPLILALALAPVSAVAADGRASAGLVAGAGDSASGDGPTYVNPVSDPGAENFGSPSVIRGRDGYWYAFGPGNPLRAGEPRPLFPIMRSDDLTSWTYVGDVFTEETFPAWGALSGGRWAPAIEFADGEYRLYFTLQNLPGLDRPNTAIGVATAPTPAGPWTDSGEPLVAPQRWTPPTEQPKYRTIIDAEVITAPDGQRYLYYGGFGGGVWVSKLSADGMATVGEERQVAVDSTYEGPFVIRRDGWYYLLVSSAHCCRGPVTSYSVFAGRSRDPMGPFRDRDGVALSASSPGGTPVVTPNGNRWVGTGHNAAITDLAGRDWITVNGIDRADPYLTGESGPVRRPLLLDRLDWIDGWPVVRAGAGVSDEPVAAPEADGLFADAFEGADLARSWRGQGWSLAAEPAGGFARAAGGSEPLVLRQPVGGDVRFRAAVRAADERGAVGVDLGLRRRGSPALSVRIDGRELVVRARRSGSVETRRAGLPESFTVDSWHDLEVEVTGGVAVARVSDAGLFDPVVQVTVPAPHPARGGLALVAAGGADVDDVTLAAPADPVTQPVPVPVPGELLDGDEFEGGTALGSSWVRGPAGTVRDGRLAMPVASTDLTGTSNSAAVLLRDAPDDTSWVAQTRMTLNFGNGPWRAFPQAGLVAYADDDSYVRLTARGHRSVRVADYQAEKRFAGRTVAASGTVGPVADTMWLQLAHTVDPRNGEHEVRAATSRDGRHWTWGQTHVLPAGSDIRVGLVAHGAAPDDSGELTARFDHLRVHALEWSRP